MWTSIDERQRPVVIAADKVIVHEFLEPIERAIAEVATGRHVVDDHQHFAAEALVLRCGPSAEVLDSVEIRNLLKLSVFENFKVVPRQPSDRISRAIGDRNVD